MIIRYLGLLLALFATCTHAASQPRVVVSIAPVHSLAAGVMEGVAAPELLINGSVDPHTYVFKPSQMSALQHADLIVWVGETVESFLPKSLFAIGKGPKVIKLTALPQMKLLSARTGGMWEADADEHHHDRDGHGDHDGHLWLDIDNAKETVMVLVATLSDLDPQHTVQYQHNGRQMLQRLASLDQELREALVSVNRVPYIVFHDAYHYFEARYQLNAIGAISVDPEHKPGARRLSEIRRKIEENRVVCAFSQPQFPDATVSLLVEGTEVRTARLDDLGSGLQPGAELYFSMMHALAVNLRQCLTK